MNLIGINCTYSYTEAIATPANMIHSRYTLLPALEFSYDGPTGWIILLKCLEENAVTILNEMHQNTNSCRDFKGNLIDRNTVHKELQILAHDINKIINFIFELLKRKPQLDITINYFNQGLTSIKKECAKLQFRADEMILKSVSANGILLHAAAKLDVNSSLNNIPKELINIFATKMFELKLDEAKK